MGVYFTGCAGGAIHRLLLYIIYTFEGAFEFLVDDVLILVVFQVLESEAGFEEDDFLSLGLEGRVAD